MIAFQRDLSQVLEKTFWVVKLVRGWAKIYLHFKGAEKEICNYKFSKVNALGKGRSGAHSLEETCLKCVQGEGSQRPF